MSDAWTIRRVLEWAAGDLRSRENETPRLDAEVMLAHVLRLDRTGLLTDADRPLSKDELKTYRELHKRRRLGEPVAYLRGVREFYGRDFHVDRRVLIPRPDSERLVEVALAASHNVNLCGSVLDLCTGSGCVAITIAAERPTMRVVATDISTEALEVARNNALRLGVIHNVTFAHGDLFGAVQADERFDVITANPPYIPQSELASLAVDVRAFEPSVALVGGADGYELMRRVVADALSYLVEGGTLAVEVGAGQAAAVRKLFEVAGFTEIQLTRDYASIERVVSGTLRQP